MFAGNFAPRGWALCDGQLLPISHNQALFAIVGTTYGGDGKTTFALPDLRGRLPMHAGTGPGLHPRQLGERDGQDSTDMERVKAGGAGFAQGDVGLSLHLPPYAVVNFIIALEGIFPSRN